MSQKEDSFKIFVPATLVKSKTVGGKTKMVLRGIASTSVTDSQGESLNPEGFDLSYFKKHGYVNWDHQTKNDPLSLIGRPTTNTKIEKGQMLIEAELFADNPRAQDAYKMQEILQTNGLALGWSIEGKATERGALKKGQPGWEIVKKARITGVALTPNPINEQTVAEIVKSHNFNLPLSAYEDSSDQEQSRAMKGMNTSSAEALLPESLDDEIRDINSFSKGEVYKKLFEDFPQLEMDSADRIYQLTKDIEKSTNSHLMKGGTNNPNISQDSLSKAYAALGLDEEAEDATILEKSEIEDLDQEVVDASMSILQKAGYTIIKSESAEEESEEEESEEGEEEEPKEKMEKSSLASLIKSEVATIIEQNKVQSQAVGTLIKGFNERLDDMSETITILQKETPGIKSIQTRNFIEKSQSSDLNGKDDKAVVSLSRNKADIINFLDDKCGLSKGEITNQLLADSVCMYESSSQADNVLVKALTDEGLTVIG